MTSCLDCGAPVRKGRWSRCTSCAAELVAADNRRRNAKGKALGYRDPDVRAAMDAAIRRDGECKWCGTKQGLTAHYMPGGEHSSNVADFLTLCRRCHGRVDGGRAHNAPMPRVVVK